MLLNDWEERGGKKGERRGEGRRERGEQREEGREERMEEKEEGRKGD